MIKESELTELLSFDLETSSEYSSFDELEKNDERKAALWITKCQKASVKDPEKWSDYKKAYIEQTSLIPEFGRIVCASFCHLVIDTTTGTTVYRGRIKSYYDNKATSTSEKTLVLDPVNDLLTKLGKTGKRYRLMGHNIKKFDIPFLAKRMIIHSIAPPDQLQTWGKKPWEIDSVDTGELWSMGDWGNYSSLDLLSCVLGVPSSKTTMKGEYVGASFWLLKKYEEIKDYCEEDVKCAARICHTLSGSSSPIEF